MTETEGSAARQARAHVGLFVTCLVDLFRPGIGFAAVRLLQKAGYRVTVPAQGCCGQPGFNGGDSDGARSSALAVIDAFEGFDYVVVPSGSCAAMVKRNYPDLFPPDSADARRAQTLAERTWELTAFLCEVAGVTDFAAEFDGSVAVHDSCSGLRELGIREQPRMLLDKVRGCSRQELAHADVCCGFGGLFCVKYPDVSNRMAQKKIADLSTTREPVDAVVAIDLGCLLHLGGKLGRDGSGIEALHIAELLDGVPRRTGGSS